MQRQAIAVYVLTNRGRSVLYVGVTHDLPRRICEHRAALNPAAFTARYGLGELVLYEPFESIFEAIRREKQLKGWSRAKKRALVEATNPAWRDLTPDLSI